MASRDLTSRGLAPRTEPQDDRESNLHRPEPSAESTPGAGPQPRRYGRAWLPCALTLGVVSWEYLLSALMNPDVDWNVLGVAGHMALDLVLVLPLIALALAVGRWSARRLALRLDESGGLLGTVGFAALAALLFLLPLTSTRDLAHEWVGVTYGLSLAEVQTTVVTSDLTKRESTQLCSFGSLRNPSLARDSYDFQTTAMARFTMGLRDALIQQAALLPLLLVAFLGQARRQAGLPAGWLGLSLPASWARAASRRLRQRLVWHRGTPRLGLLALATVVLFCVGYGVDQPGVGRVNAEPGAPFNACVEGGPVKEYDVHAIDVTITLNRWGDHVEDAYMYALEANIPAIRDFETALEADRTLPEGEGVTRVSLGLRKDLIQPLVIRANLGECLRINFTNSLVSGKPASMHILGLPHSVNNASSAVGNNPDTFAQAGETLTYEIPLPLDPDAERAYYFHDHGAGRQRQNKGLFGAIIAEPRGATYLDVETGEPLDTVTGSNWEAIIIDPNVDNRPDGKSFREFAIFYHEIGDEAFTNIQDQEDKLLPLIDEVANVYRPAARAINYRSEPFRRRIELDQQTNGENAGHGKSLGYASYPFGDPPTPIPRSYVGEGVKTRLLHGGSEVFHVHHLHGGGDRWRRNPNADPANDFWKGLTKVPDPNLTSIHLDSQSIGPGTSYNLEHECGAGGCQQGVGEFLFHCHIGHHYIAGMWSFWRVFGTEQTAETNINGVPLAVIPELFQSESPFADASSNTPPDLGVSAGDLLGLRVDDGRVLSVGPTGPGTKNLEEWITDMLPPQGVPLDNNDATVWNWTTTGSGASLRVWGEPDEEVPFAGWTSPIPGQRPEVLFNAKNGRYSWPLFRPQNSQRPPFTPRHTGAPWLGEEMKDGRPDGLCAKPELVPEIGPGAVKRYYPLSAITLPIQVTPDGDNGVDPDGMIFVLNEHEEAIRNGEMPAEPLTVRSNVGDCVELVFTNKIPDSDKNKNFSKVNVHSHFVQFDTQASDGVITGFSYEQSVRPYENEARWLTAPAGAGTTTLAVNHTDRLRPGIWLGIGLGEATCGVSAEGQPLPCTEIRKILSMTDTSITLDRPLINGHEVGDAVGVEFVRYHWFSDVDFGTVFYHTHVEFQDWDHGLFGTHVVEPKGSTYHDPQTGEEVRAGTLVDIHVDPAAGGNPVAHGVEGSFREFMLFLHNQNPVEGRFTLGGGTINLRAEPWRLRDSEAAYRFSSVTHGDPHTQQIRAYVGDPLVVRGMGLVERVGGVRFTGHRFNMERYTDDSDTRDATFIGISERFDVSLEGGAGGPGGYPGDYLYYSTLGKDFESGAWGLLRVHDSAQEDLQPLPDRPAPGDGEGFPQLAVTGAAPAALEDGPGDACPPDAQVREYSVVVDDSSIIYNEVTARDNGGVSYALRGEDSKERRTPLVVRANEGECLRVKLKNRRRERSAINFGELLFDPQRSYGAAIGFNHDSTVGPGLSKVYEFFADRELGIVIGMNLGDIDSVERGAFAAAVVEPEGSEYFRPGTREPLPAGGAGIQADILTNGLTTREFVALFSDEDRRIGQNAMPYPVAVERFAGINYSHEPLDIRGLSTRPDEVFKSDLWGDPRHVVTVNAGTPLVYRVAQPWGNQTHVPTLEGHRYPLEPGLVGSEQIFNDVLVPGLSLNLHFVGGAGGDLQEPGDYLFLDRRQPFLEYGLWNLLRVTERGGASGGSDTVKIVEADTSQEGAMTLLSIAGVNGVRPAGDTAEAVVIYNGQATPDGCRGRAIGKAEVDLGSGEWVFSKPFVTLPDEVCIRSLGGGVASMALGQ
ncbi:MAG: multicopper oxidase domain-containing protein [Acidobacteriota bacterium]